MSNEKRQHLLCQCVQTNLAGAFAKSLTLQSYHTAVPVELQLYGWYGAVPPTQNKLLDLCDGRQECQGGMVMKRIGTYKDHCILPLLGVASNKLGSEGYLTKYNARICVRCDLWTTAEDTHSAARTMNVCLVLAAVTASST
jgi:hypothetical protein